METLTHIPFTLDREALMKQAHVEAGSDEAEEMVPLFKLATKVGNPKAAYGVAFIESRDGDTVRVGGVTFTSRTLVKNLESVERVFPMVATCGCEMDEAFADKGDVLKEFWWDLIKLSLLRTASKHLDDHLHRKFRLNKTASMRPGSGDAAIWPIQQQKELFALLGDVEKAIGVRLTDSCLMVPNKTTSGLMFPTEKDFRSCEVCHRENCPNRHAPFNKQLWADINHD